MADFDLSTVPQTFWQRVWTFEPTLPAVDTDTDPGTEPTASFAPTVTGARGLNPLEVEVSFSEDIAYGAALSDPATYTLTPAAGSLACAILSASRPVPDKVVVALATPLSRGAANYTITVGAGVFDLDGAELDPDHDTAIFDGPGDHAEPEIADHCEDAKDRLAAQFRDKPIIGAVVCAVADRVQAIEQAEADLLVYRSLDAAVGVQLDKLGELLGYRRPGALSDATYRLRLRARVLVISSEGHPNRMLEILALLDNGFSDVSIADHMIATAIMHCEVPVGQQLLGEEWVRFLRDAKAGAVRLILQFEEQGEPLFGFEDDVTAFGFEDDGDGGGIFAEAVA